MGTSTLIVDPPLGANVAPASGKTRRIDRAFWIVSLIIVLTDIAFISVNYFGARDVMLENLAAKGARQEQLFSMYLRTHGLHMQQTAAHIANQPQVRALFLAGREAVMAEGGGAGGKRAAELRQQLYELVSPNWLDLTRQYELRQLHFHMGPGDVSFLRVHSPKKFGDDLSPVRHTITHAIRDNHPTHGFESGRVYPGIRGVVPIAVDDPQTGTPVAVGALEAGKSFAQMLRILGSETSSAFAVLLTRDYFFDTHWPDFARKQLQKHPMIGDWFVEGSDDEPLLRALLHDNEVFRALGERRPVISSVEGQAYAVYSFPFRDFLREAEPHLPAIGTIVTYHAASDSLAAFDNSFRTNIYMGVFAFLLVETLLFAAWTVARRRLQRVIDEKTAALSASNDSLQIEVESRLRTERELKNQRLRLEVEVAQRTRSLSDSVAALEEEMAYRRAVEQELQRERDQAHVTLQSIIDGVITADIRGCVMYLNPAAAQLTGWSESEARGQHLDAVFPARDLEHGGYSIEFSRCLSGRCERQHGENTELTRRDGSQVIVEHSLSPIRNEDGSTLGLVLVFHDDTEARQLAVQLSHQASHDALTGLTNRRALEVELGEALNSSQVDGDVHAFLYIDLDQFKVVNDTCGHIAGDELLKQLSKLLEKNTRQSDTLARLGGDEFGLLLRNCPVEKASRIAEGLLESLRSFHFVWDERSFRVGASIGVAVISADTESVESILSAADAACYLAKDKGRSRVQLSLPDDGELQHRRGEMQWVSKIQQALEEDRLVLYGQPIVPLRSGANAGSHEEILVRMLDEQGELIPPNAFIPAAERYGLMPEVDRWIVDRTFQMINRAASLWPTESPGTYSINLSGETMADEGILTFIRERFERYRIDPAWVCFEVTETAAIANLARAIDLMSALKQDGCRFALDDFGSGLSSFGYLKALPVDYLKIDGSFVRNMDSDRVDYVMVKAINEVGHAMSLQTIAEFVENDVVVDALRELGVDFAQGYGIGRPAVLPGNEAASD